MSQENVEIVKRLLDAINRRDRNVVDEFATPDAEFVPALEGSVEGQAYRGREGWESYLAEIEETWEELRIFGDQFRDLDDRVIVLGGAEGRGRGSGVPVATPFAMILELRDGKILRSRSFLDHGEALRAAGLTD
jgi:ketosteroid isomerase-like protein